MSRKGKDRLFIAVCVLPAVLLFSLFILYPMAKGFMMSFYRYSGLGGSNVYRAKKFSNVICGSNLSHCYEKHGVCTGILPINDNGARHVICSNVNSGKTSSV